MIDISNVFTFKKENQVEIAFCSLANSFISIVNFCLWNGTWTPKVVSSVTGSNKNISMTTVPVVCQGTKMIRKRHASRLSSSTSSHLVISCRWWSPSQLFVCPRYINFLQGSPNLGSDVPSSRTVTPLMTTWGTAHLFIFVLTTVSWPGIFLWLEPRRPVQPLDGFLWCCEV